MWKTLSSVRSRQQLQQLQQLHLHQRVVNSPRLMSTNTMTTQDPVLHLYNYINGKKVKPLHGKYIENRNPATGEILSHIPLSNDQDVDLAVKAAQDAFYGTWGQLKENERVEYCQAFSKRILERLPEFALAESRDTGKPIALSSSLDIPRSANNFQFFADFYQHFTSPFHPMDNGINYTSRRPLGVVGLISPWNLPLYLLTWKIAPALVMGNTIVAKPSELTPTTATLLMDIADEIGLPPGVLNLVHGTGKEAGQALVEHRGVAAISFTGGTSTGAIVASTAAKTFKKVSLELGGKNPNVIFADSDIKEALNMTLKSSFTNSGQICLCGSRILVEASIYDQFVNEFVLQTKELMKVGIPEEPETKIGSVISQEHLNKIENYVNLAKEEGGNVLCGGKRVDLGERYKNGAFYEPTIIENLPLSSRVVQEEIFGPVVTIHKFQDEKDALEQANGVCYGLSASVWTQNLTKAHRFAQNLSAGLVWVNSWMVRDLRTPFGGVKKSGMGREGGTYSLEFFSETKNIYIHLPKTWEESSSSNEIKKNDHQNKDNFIETNKTKVVKEKNVNETITSAKTHVVQGAPKAVGAYPHARRHGNLLFLSGIGPRHPETNAIPGGPIHDTNKNKLEYDIQAQTEAVIENVRIILEGSGSSMDKIVDVQVYLINMERDFQKFNQVYNQHFCHLKATRTTCAIQALPTPIAVEFKVIASI